MAVLLLACAAAPVNAGPASWYLWASKIDGKSLCRTTSPGKGWKLESGPYQDHGCTRRGKRMD